MFRLRFRCDPLTCALLLSLVSVAASAQAQERIVIPLTINLEVEQFSGQVIASRTNDASMVYSTPASDRTGHAPDNVLFKLEPVASSVNTYYLTIDANGDGDFRNDTPQTLAPNTVVVASITRRWPNGKQLVLPYSIRYSREADAKGRMREMFLWSPHYRAEGRLKVGKCETLFTAFDLNTDGRFDKDDFAAGTSIGVDRDGNGRVWGREEYLTGNQIIDYCGERYLVDAVAADGTSITLVKTSLRVPKLGETLPEFSLTTLDGQTLESKTLRNKIYLLDFWASWCKPCVEKFGLVKQLAAEFKTEVSVIAINVDEESVLPKAHQAIREYGLTWPHVMNGLGEGDPLWKMFGGMEGNRLAIPLYVIVDSEGRLRYAANGGNDLSELRKAIRALLK